MKRLCVEIDENIFRQLRLIHPLHGEVTVFLRNFLAKYVKEHENAVRGAFEQTNRRDVRHRSE